MLRSLAVSRRFFASNISQNKASIPVSHTTRRGLDYAPPKSPFVPSSPAEIAVKPPTSSPPTQRTPFQMMKLPLTQLLAPIVGKGPAKKIARDMEGLFSKSFPPLPSTSPSMNRPLFNPLSSFSSLSSLNVQVLEREAGDNKPFRAKATVTDPAATIKVEVVKNSLSGLSSMIISSDLSSTTHSDDRRVDGQLVKLSRFTKQREASMIPLPPWVDAATLSASSIADGKEILIEAKPLSAKSSNNNMIPKMTEAVPISSSTMASPASIDLSSTPPEWKDGWMVGP